MSRRIRLKIKRRDYLAVWTVAGIAALLIIWECASLLIGSELILPPPFSTMRKLFSLIPTSRFIFAALGSFTRVLLGLVLAMPVATAIGLASGINARANAFFRPFFSVVAATPVLSIILIAILWFGQNRTPIFTAFLMVFPVMAANVTEGVRSTDVGLIEISQVYHLSRLARLRHLYFPTLAPFLLAGVRSSLSMCWKVVVAAEVIAQPIHSLGAGMQMAKAQLETTELFAWTAATILFAGVSEIALGLLRWRSHGAHHR